MGHLTLTLLCLWSCILTVTPLESEHLKTAIDYFQKEIFKGHERQYAYFVRFTSNECNTGLQENDLKSVMNEINAADVLTKVKGGDIYEGTRMVAAGPKALPPPAEAGDTEHSEYRLLYPDNDSPISRLLNSDTGCVIFFSLNSPCVGTCIDLNGEYNIITKLKNIKNLPNNSKDKAFVFKNVFRYDKEKDKELVWNSWEGLNQVIPFFRCFKKGCFKCFENNVRDQKCYTSKG